MANPKRKSWIETTAGMTPLERLIATEKARTYQEELSQRAKEAAKKKRGKHAR